MGAKILVCGKGGSGKKVPDLDMDESNFGVCRNFGADQLRDSADSLIHEFGEGCAFSMGAVAGKLLEALKLGEYEVIGSSFESIGLTEKRVEERFSTITVDVRVSLVNEAEELVDAVLG